MEKLDLDWHTFSDHLFSTSKSFMETKELADVTLISDDQKQLYAHKVFLSAGSEVIRNILINNTHKHPVIYLTNIKHQELEAIIQFIYLGKATFYQDKMGDFLSAARNLQIKEIATGFEMNDETDDTEGTYESQAYVPANDSVKQTLPQTDQLQPTSSGKRTNEIESNAVGFRKKLPQIPVLIVVKYFMTVVT